MQARVVAKTKHASKVCRARSTRRGGTHRDVKRLRSGHKTSDRRHPAMNQESNRNFAQPRPGYATCHRSTLTSLLPTPYALELKRTSESSFSAAAPESIDLSA